MYTKKDIEEIAKIIIKNEFKRIFVVGMIGSGKSSFSKEISQKVGYRNIELDFLNRNNEFSKIEDLLNIVLEKEKENFVINHSDIISFLPKKKNDIVIFLNPNKEELLISREKRKKNKSIGDWQKIQEKDYDFLIKENEKNFKRIKGEIIYKNIDSGVFVKKIE